MHTSPMDLFVMQHPASAICSSITRLLLELTFSISSIVKTFLCKTELPLDEIGYCSVKRHSKILQIISSIKSRLKSENACYPSVHNILSSTWLSRNMKIKIHRA